jgi:hypothetical protein
MLKSNHADSIRLAMRDDEAHYHKVLDLLKEQNYSFQHRLGIMLKLL